MTRWRDLLPAAPAGTFWGSLPAADREALAAAGAVRRLVRGTVLSREGQRSGRVWVILSGQVQVSLDDPAGHRTLLSVRRPGDVIGELSAVDGRPASATTVLAEDGTVLVLTAARFAAVCQERPALCWLLLTGVVGRFRASVEGRGRLRADVRDRVVLALIDAAGDATGPVVLRTTQQQLADSVSASLVSVTRALDELRAAGAVTTGRGRIGIPDVARLRSLAP